MAGSRNLSLIIITFLMLLTEAQGFQVDLECLAQHRSWDSENRTNLQKAGLGIRRIIQDSSGDRLLLFMRLEAEDNFKENHVEQLYAKYKGPMGKWNITLGRMNVPFGLITEYDTEWQVIKTLERQTIGFRNDDGVKLSGFKGPFDYELLIGQGEGIEDDEDSRGMGTFRTVYRWMGDNELSVGMSLLYNRTRPETRKLAGIDLIAYRGLMVFRSELVAGKGGQGDILSLFTGMDYSLFPAIDLNLGYSYFREEEKESVITLGASWNSPYWGLVFRAGTRYHINDFSEDGHEILIQVYRRFSAYF